MEFRVWLEERERPKIIDTKGVGVDDERIFLHAAIPLGNGAMEAWHVCDNPEKVLMALRNSKDIYEIYGAEHDDDELGPGLYVSAVPQLWMGRARGKWDFLQGLSAEDRRRIADEIKKDDKWTLEGRYLASFEIEYGLRDLEAWVRDGRNDYGIVSLAGQPFNMPVWRPEWLGRLGIKAGNQPKQVSVIFQGRFVDLTDQRDDWREFRAMGLDGAFHKGGFTTTGQISIWRKKSIISFNGKNLY